jgi:hypothetical protein
MRADTRALPVAALAALLGLAPCAVSAQTAADGPLLAARAVDPTAQLKLYNPAGSVRIFAWDRDSIVIRGTVPREHFYFGADRRGGKGGVEDPRMGGTAVPAHIVVYMPRHGGISVKTASADITTADIAGWYYTVSGSVHVSGSVTSVDVESMSGNIDLDVTTPWARARTGQGHILLRGSPQDVDASTVGGALDIATSAILRGRFSSVSGDIRYASAPAAGALFEFSNHGGSVDLLVPATVSGRFELSSVTGEIANGFSQVRPVSAGPHSLRLNLGRGESQFSIRTFKGTIRLRPR